VQDHGGDVVVERTSTAGTTFRIGLPMTPAPEDALAAKHEM
jgi:chemotaxis protein histidine kinase CheA